MIQDKEARQLSVELSLCCVLHLNSNEKISFKIQLLEKKQCRPWSVAVKLSLPRCDEHSNWHPEKLKLKIDTLTLIPIVIPAKDAYSFITMEERSFKKIKKKNMS